MITFYIDDVTPCLIEVDSGDIYETEIVRLRRKSVLSKYNSKTGWYINWAEFPDSTEIYALMLKGTMSIQGLIALENDDDSKSIHMLWGCTAPHNNIWENNKQRFSGVGGHLIAFASELSMERGYDGFICAEAIDHDLLNYYIDKFGALPLPSLGGIPYRFMITGDSTQKLREVYTYERTNEIL